MKTRDYLNSLLGSNHFCAPHYEVHHPKSALTGSREITFHWISFLQPHAGLNLTILPSGRVCCALPVVREKGES